MAVEGTQLPDSKRIVISLKIYGIGQSLSKKILLKTGIQILRIKVFWKLTSLKIKSCGDF